MVQGLEAHLIWAGGCIPLPVRGSGCTLRHLQRAFHAIPGIGTVGVRPLGHAADGRRQVVVPAAADHCWAGSNNHDAGPERGQPAEG